MSGWKTAAGQMVASLGGLSLARRARRKGLRILMYHRFPEGAQASLEEQCRHYRRHYNLLSLTEVADLIHSGGPFPPRSLTITVDDGYRDFFLVAYPVFRVFQIPATVFLVTDFLDGKTWLWTDALRYMFANTGKLEAALPAVQGTLPLNSQEQRARAREEFTRAAKLMPNAERVRFLKELSGELAVSLPVSPPERYAPMAWEQARTMSANGIEFGAHTKSHPILTRIENKSELRAEIEGSRQRIEEELRRPAAHFCYPNGRDEDFSDAVIAATKRAGFRTAVTTKSGLNYPGCEAFQLRRIGVEPNLPQFYFETAVAGWRS